MPKNILIAFAGTGQDRDGPDRDNPSLLCDILDEASYPASQQVHCYIRGIGTDQSTSMGQAWEQMKANTFPDKVMEGYRFLAEHYQPGDKIFLTGFSRGAALARSLAGMIRNVGIIKAENVNKKRIKEAYQAYIGDKSPDDAKSIAFRNKYSHFNGVEIACLAVFDTVLAWDQDGFHDLFVNDRVEVFRHAISIDERREDFDWMPATTDPRYTDSEQRLFPGVHSDVGGSYQHRGLAQNSFFWLLTEMVKCGLQVPDWYMQQLRNSRIQKHVSDDKESDFSDVSSSDYEDEVDNQRDADLNAWDKLHASHAKFPFNWRGTITRNFDTTTDMTIDGSVKARQQDPKRKYRPRGLSASLVKQIEDGRKQYEDSRNRAAVGRRVTATTTVNKSIADPSLAALCARKKRDAASADLAETVKKHGVTDRHVRLGK